MATFDSGGNTNCTIDVSSSVSGIDIKNTYSQTITDTGGTTLTVGASNFLMAGGTFNANGATLDLNGSFTLSGGTFNSDGSSFTLAGVFTVSAGTFNEGTSTWTLDGNNGSLDVNSTETFYNFTVAAANNWGKTLAAADTLIVTNTLTFTDGIMDGGTIKAQGNTITCANTADGGTTIVDFDSAGAQTLTVNSGICPVIRLDHADDASDSITFAAAGTLSGLTVTAAFSGTIPISNASDFAMTVTTWNQAAGTFNGNSFSNLTIKSLIISGGTFTAPTTVTTAGSAPSIDVNSTQTFNNVTVTATAGGLSIASGDTITTTGTLTFNRCLSGGTIKAQGAITQNAGCSSNSTTIIDFDAAGAQTYTINGGRGPVVRLDDAADASDSISFAAAGELDGLTITAGFAGTIPISNGGDFAMTVYTWDQAAGTFSGNSFSNLTMDDLIISGGTFTATTTVTMTGSVPTMDVNSTQTFNNVTITSAAGGFGIASGDTITTTGTLTFNRCLSGGTIKAQGAITQNAGCSSNSTTIIDFDAAGAQTYTINGGRGPVVRLDDAADASDSISFAAAGELDGLTITAGFAGTIPISNGGDFAMTVYTWDQAAGTFSGNSFSNLTLGTMIMSGGTFNAPTTVTIRDSNPTWNVNVSQTFNNLTLNLIIGGLTISAGDTLIATGTLTLNNGANNSGATGILEAQGNVVVGNTFDSGAGPLRFAGSATQTFDLTGVTGLYNGDILVNKTGGQVNLLSDLVMDANNQDLFIQEGTFDVNAHNLTVNGIAGQLDVESGGNLQLQGGETITANASNPDIQAGSTITYDGSVNSTIKDYTYHHLALIGNATWTMGASEVLGGNLTVSAGTFDIVDKNLTVTGTVSNTATIKMNGNQTVTWTNDTDSGFVVYSGAGSYSSLAGGNNYYNLTIDGSGSFQMAASTDVNGTLTILQGTLDANGQALAVGGNWAHTGGSYTHGNNTVTFDTSSLITTVSGSTTFYNVTSTTAGKKFIFTAGTTQTVSNNLTLTGSNVNMISLRSSSAGSYWNLNSNGTENVSFVDVKDSDASGGTQIAAVNATDAGHNLNWTFTGWPAYPTGLGPASYVNGSNVTDSTPTLTFTLDDPENDQVQYQILIDDTADFSSPLVNFTSALQAEGATSFTVGQLVGSGTYTVGADGQSLPYGSYYWQVKAIDASAHESGYTVANDGAVAFVVKVYTVTKTADTSDGVCNSDCSLREAITAAVADAYSPRNIAFGIDNADPGRDANCVNATGVCTITPTSALPVLSVANVTIDGYTQPGAVTNTNPTGAINAAIKIQIDGTSAGAGVYGIEATQGPHVLKGLSIYNFTERGIYLHAAGNGTKIQGCFVGIKADGATGAANGTGGIYTVTSASHIIGTDGDGVNDAAERNLISGNGTVTTDPAISMVTNSNNNVVAGNLIGLNAAGTAAVANAGSGVFVSVTGTRIGTNGDGVSDTIERNVISGSGSYGISIAGASTRVSGNYIGTNAAGSAAVANTSSAINIASNTNTIGTNGDGTNDGIEGNVVSGNSSRGIYVASGTGNVIAGNIVGLDAAGAAALANGLEGIKIDSNSNRVGTNGDGTSDAEERNVISANTTHGVRITGGSSNVIAGNYIGVAADGTTDRGQGTHGIFIESSAASNTIGGDVAAEANVIAFNGNAANEYGVSVIGANSDGNNILRNKFFSNQNEGIKLDGAGANNDEAVPTISTDACSSGNLDLTGTTGAGEVVQIFDASGDNEGETYLAQVTADGSGNWSVSITDPAYVSKNNVLVATATNGTNGTSPFTGAYTAANGCDTRHRLIIINDD